MNKAVYTAIIDGKDDLIDVSARDDGYDFIAFSDTPDIAANGWEVRPVTREFSDPTRDARKHKLLSHVFLPDYDYTLWIDGNIILGDLDLDALFAAHLEHADVALHQHPKRTCIYTEGEVCIEMGKDNPETITAQMEKYRGLGYPKDNGLISTCIMYRRQSPQLAELERAWWEELHHNSRRDQLSFNYVAWTLGQAFTVLPGHVRTDDVPGFSIIKHKKLPDFLNW